MLRFTSISCRENAHNSISCNVVLYFTSNSFAVTTHVPHAVLYLEPSRSDRARPHVMQLPFWFTSNSFNSMLCFTSKLCETPFSIKLSPETYLDRVSAPPHVIQLHPALQLKFESLHDVDSFETERKLQTMA